MAIAKNVLLRRSRPLRDLRTLTTMFISCFGSDPGIKWLYQLPPDGTPSRQPVIEEVIRMRKSNLRRALVDSAYHSFIAYDEKTGQPMGSCAWIAPGTAAKDTFLRRRRPGEYALEFLYKVYDGFAYFCMPDWLESRLFYPHLGESIYARQDRAGAFATKVQNTYIKPEYHQQGYWSLAILGVLPEHRGNGIAKELLECGLRMADKEDRAVIITDASPDGVQLYLKAGFKEVGRETLFPGEELGGFVETVMCRERRSIREKSESPSGST